MLHAKLHDHSLQIVDPICSESIHGRSILISNRKERLIVEIEQLRRQMVDAVLEGSDFSSQNVVKISQSLDQKLNEYMLV